MAREEVARSSRQSDGCVQYETLLQELVLDILPRRKRSLLAAHLRKCSACREYLRQARCMPAVLASIPTPEPPADLAEQIKGACLVASLVSRRQAPSMVWARMSYAGATAAALLMLVALSYLPIAVRSAHHELAAVIFKEPVIIVPASSQEPASPSGVANPAEPRAVVSVRPAVLRQATAPAQRRWYAPPARLLAPRRVAAAPRVRQAALPQPAASRGQPRAGAGRGAAGNSASSPMAGMAPAAGVEPSIEGVNGRVAHGVAAGVLAGALIEHYLADAIARRGTELVTAGLAAPSMPTDTPTGRVPSDAVPAAM